MNAVPPSFPLPGNDSLDSLPGRSVSPGEKWVALHQAAEVVATLAGVEASRNAPAVRDFPQAIGQLGGWRRELAEKGIDDLAAIMEPGIAALLSVNARKADPTAPALALWREFQAARDALLALVPAEGDVEL